MTKSGRVKVCKICGDDLDQEDRAFEDSSCHQSCWDETHQDNSPDEFSDADPGL